MVEGTGKLLVTSGGGGASKSAAGGGGGAIKSVTSTGEAYATKSWKDAALKVDINGYVSNMELRNVKLVSW